MKAILLPFSYPGYPKDIVDSCILKSIDFLKSLQIDFDTAPTVRTLNDCCEAENYSRSGDYSAVIVLLASWVEPPLITKVLNNTNKPILLWTLDNFLDDDGQTTLTLGAIPSGCVMRESLSELGYRFHFLIASPYDLDGGNEIITFLKAAKAEFLLQRGRLGFFGYASMGMYTGICDHINVKRFFGTELLQFDQYTLINGIENIPNEDILPLVNTFKENFSLLQNIDDKLIYQTLKTTQVIEKIIKSQKLDGLTVKCQYEMSVEYGFAPCVALSLIGELLPTACEGDIFCLLSQFVLHSLSGKVTTYGDLHGFSDDHIILAACGFAPKSFLPSKPSVQKHTALYEGLLMSEPFSSIKKATLIRIAADGEGFKIHILTGRVEPLNGFHEVDCPAYAGCRFYPDKISTNDIKNQVMSQHYALVEGDYYSELLAFCKLKGIRIVTK